MQKTLLAASAFFLMLGRLPTNAVYAHDLVLIPAGPRTVTLEFGHPQEYQAPDAGKLLQLRAYVDGPNSPISLLSAFTGTCGDHASIDFEPLLRGRNVLIVSGQYDNGYWSSPAGKKYFNTSRLQIPSARDSGYFLKFAKTLFPAAGANASYGRALGMRLEIIPRSDPFKVHPGVKLPVEVLWEGKPLAGAAIELGDGKTRIIEADVPKYATDANGVALVPIGDPGLRIIAVEYRTAPQYPQLSDYDDYGATLTFFVPADSGSNTKSPQLTRK